MRPELRRVHGPQIPLFELPENDVELAPHVILISDKGRWEKGIEQLSVAPYFGFDIETYGLQGKTKKDSESLNAWQGEIRLISVGLPSGESMVADLGGWNANKAEFMKANDAFLAALKDAVESPAQVTIGHNLSFDGLFVMCHWGWVIRNLRDTELMSRVFYAGLGSEKSGFRFPHTLKEVAWRSGLGEVDKSEQKSDYGWGISNKQRNYSASDSLLVIKVWQRLGAKIKEAGLTGPVMAECGAIPAFIHMMYHGMPVDLQRLETMRQQIMTVRKEVLQPFVDLFPHVNAGSPTQVVQALNARFKLGITAANDEVLTNIKNPPEAVAAIKGLLLWRTISIQDAYLEGIQERMFSGRIRTKLRALGGSGQGRSTSSSKDGGVQLQNPANLTPPLKKLGLKSVRSVFRAKPGYKFLVADLSQAHSRIATCASKDPVLLKAYQENLDIHAITAAQLAKLKGLGPEWTSENIGKWRKDKKHPNNGQANQLRQLAKPTFYSSLNMGGAHTLVVTGRTAPEPVIMTEDEAKQGIDAWRKTYAGLYKFQRGIIKMANKYDHFFQEFIERYPWMEKVTFGEVRGLTNRRLFLMKSQTDFGLSVKGTDCVAMVWMSTEADAIKTAMARILDEMYAHPEWDAKMCNFVHDELDFEVLEAYAKQLARVVLLHMNTCMQEVLPGVPAFDETVTAESLICDSWADK